MSLAVWLGAVRKCSAAVVGLDMAHMALGLSMVRRCSLKRSFKRRLVSSMYCLWEHRSFSGKTNKIIRNQARMIILSRRNGLTVN